MLVNNRFLPYLYTMIENKRYQLDDGFCVCEYRGNCQEALTGYAHLPHQLQKNAVLICLQGEITIGMNLHDCGLRKLDMTFIPEKTIIESFSCSADAQCLICLFNKGYYEDDSIDNTLIRQQFLITPSYHIQDDAIEEILTLFRLIERKIEEPDNLYKKKAVKGYIQVLMSLGYNSMRQSSALSSQAHASRSQEVFQQFLLLAHQHYRKEHSISFYADKICLTPKYFSQLVLQASGQLAGEWINRYLMLDAKALLLDQKYTIMEISEKLCFSSSSAFIAFFKKQTGTTPKQYRMNPDL